MDLQAWFRRRGVELQALPGGGSVPLRFTDAVLEHHATREQVGLFDFSFMGAWHFSGRAACDALAQMQTRNLRALHPGRIAYTLMLNDAGGVVIDATVWRLAVDRYWLFAGRRDEAGRIAQLCRRLGVAVVPMIAPQAVLALQGPRSARLLAQLLGAASVRALPYFGFAMACVDGIEVCVGRLGYSGELGYEIIAAASHGPALWQRLVALGTGHGLLECGFEAADSLRIEAGHVLFSRELVAAPSPQALGLARLVDLNGAGPFIGREALRRQRFAAPSCRLVGLCFEAPGPAQPGGPTPAGCPELAGRTRRTGHPGRSGRVSVSSECESPTLHRPIGLGWVDADAAPGDRLRSMDGRLATVNRLPFRDAPRTRPRAQPAL